MTKTIIANLALSKIGDMLIDDITDTGDKASRMALLHYEPTLKEVLRAHFWGFAMVTKAPDIVVIPDDADAAEIIGWTTAFTLPDDFIKLRSVMDEAGKGIDKFDFRRVDATRCILTGDYDAIVLDYVAFVDDPDSYDPLFLAAFTTLLASRLARPISGSDALESQLRQTYETVDLPTARCADGHDTQSAENHPLREFLDGSLTGQRADYFPELD